MNDTGKNAQHPYVDIRVSDPAGFYVVVYFEFLSTRALSYIYIYQI